MTRAKSDSQLDAEAQGRVVAPALRESRITRWRAAYAAEPSTRLSSYGPPEMTEKVDGVAIRVIDAGTRVGVSMSGAFLRYLDGSGGRQFPVHDALLGWDRLCRSKHAMWPDHRGRPVCAEIAWNVIRDGWSVNGAAQSAGVSFPRAENLLRLAVKWMHDRQELWLKDSPHSQHDREMCDVCRADDARAA